METHFNISIALLPKMIAVYVNWIDPLIPRAKPYWTNSLKVEVDSQGETYISETLAHLGVGDGHSCIFDSNEDRDTYYNNLLGCLVKMSQECPKKEDAPEDIETVKAVTLKI